MKHTIATIALAAFAAIAATVALAETRYNLPTHEQVQAVLNATVANASNDLAICYDRVAQLGGAVPPDESARTLAALPDVIYSVTNTDRFAEWLNTPSVLTDVSGAVTNLRGYAFYGCTALKSVDLPNATSIGQYAFYGCTSLTDAEIPKATDIGNYAFYTCNLNSYSNDFELTIGGYAFYGNVNLLSIHLPNARQFSGPQVFCGCTSIRRAHLPLAMFSSGAVFNGCTALESAYLPSASTINGNGGIFFNNCVNLIAVSLNAANSVVDSAFTGCTALRFIVHRPNLASVVVSRFGSTYMAKAFIRNQCAILCCSDDDGSDGYLAWDGAAWVFHAGDPDGYDPSIWDE